MIQLTHATFLNRPVQIGSWKNQVLILTFALCMIFNRLLYRMHLEWLHRVLFLPIQAKELTPLIQPLLHIEAKIRRQSSPLILSLAHSVQSGWICTFFNRLQRCQIVCLPIQDLLGGVALRDRRRSYHLTEVLSAPPVLLNEHRMIFPPRRQLLLWTATANWVLSVNLQTYTVVTKVVVWVILGFG